MAYTCTTAGALDKDAIMIKLAKSEYVIDERNLKALQALTDFADNAFLGYGDTELGDMENQLSESYHFLVCHYIDLLIADIKQSKEDFIGYIQEKQKGE